jgi:hypothetical protein
MSKTFLDQIKAFEALINKLKNHENNRENITFNSW